MFLFADSGSTKTEWILTSLKGEIIFNKRTIGLNPYNVNEKIIRQTLLELIPKDINLVEIKNVYFYGAGCGNSERSKMLLLALEDCFPVAIVKVYTDILGAARSAWQRQRGIAAILGTGANACAYNGESVYRTVISLGYLLGDEGSGAYLGKKLLKTYFNSKLEYDLSKALRSEYDMEYNNIMNAIYRDKAASAYLASFVPFIHKHKNYASMQWLLKQSFDNFFNRIVKNIPEHSDLPVAFVGSVAYNFQEEILASAKKNRIKVEKFIGDPLKGIVDYHLKL
ncbi:MAG: ATPase [Bacteroidales bacterium]|nr:ATPase [Bacteroidales bacterium]